MYSKDVRIWVMLGKVMLKHPNPVRLAEKMISQKKFLKSVNVWILRKEHEVLQIKSR